MTPIRFAVFGLLPMLAVGLAQASSVYSVHVFATGSAVGATGPDSVSFGDNSLWIEYQNNAVSTGGSGSSTIVRYSPSGTIEHTWSIAGNVDGLKVDPSTGLVWALQNQDGNSALTIINPATNATTPYAYGNSYTNVPNRGFDDIVFLNGQVFLSETNPVSGADGIIVRLTSGLNSPLQISPILTSTYTGTDLATGALSSTTITDPDSLKLTPSGGLALTGEADQEITFVQHPGAANQTESFLHLLGTNGQPISGDPDDTIYPTAAGGFFYFADTGANTIYQVTATGLAPGSVYIDVGDEFGILNTSNGVVTPIFTGNSPHGADFVSFADSGVPEPASAGYLIAGLAALAALTLFRTRGSAPSAQ
ncbi:MAG: hypothetical protein JO340_11960 [Acidobacteriaceae bacterium]|nr:hypothetical protein [Acidobacteriaceae bacterium]